MSIVPPIIIPSSELFVEGYCGAHREIRNKPLVSDNSLWAISVYEIWDDQEIFEDVSEKIKELCGEFDCCEYHEDFSPETRDKLELEKTRIVEGIKTLSRNGYDGYDLEELLEDLHILFFAAKSYMKAYKRIQRVMEMVEKLSYRIIQLQIDIQTASYDDDTTDFYREQKECEDEMDVIKNLGANDKEIAKLQRLMEGVESDFRTYFPEPSNA